MKTAIALLAVTLSNLEVNERIARREGRTAEADDKLAEVKDISQALLLLEGPPIDPSVPPEVAETKQFRKDLDGILQRLNVTGTLRHSRERSLAVTKIQEAIMWLGMDLKAINDANPGASPNPYPQSYNPASAAIEPTADGLTFGAQAPLLDEAIRKVPESVGDLVLGGVDLAAPGSTDSNAFGSPVLAEGAVKTAPQPESADAGPEESATASDAPESAPDAAAPDSAPDAPSGDAPAAE